MSCISIRVTVLNIIFFKHEKMSCDCRHNFKIMMCLPVTYRYDWNSSNLYRGGVTKQKQRHRQRQINWI